MDINTFLSCAASVVALITFGLEVYKITANNINTKAAPINSCTNGTGAINTTPYNPTNVTINYHAETKKNYINITNSNTRSNTSSNSNDVILFFFLLIIIGSIISKFYLNNRASIIFWLIILGILSFTITITCILILAKNRLITNSNLYIQTIKWFPLFIGIIFIYHPLYSSNSLSIVAELIQKGTGFINIFFKYTYDTLFFICQFLGIGFMALVFIGYLISTIRNTYRSLQHRILIENITLTNIILYFALLFFIFIFVSGLYVKFFQYISTIN